MKNRLLHISFFFGLAILFSVGVYAHAAHAAELYVYPQEYDIVPGDTITVEVRVDGKFDSVNVVKARIVYPPDLLRVEDLSSRGSFLHLWAEEPDDDALAGVITFTGGIERGSYVIGGKALTITFRALTQGTATVTIDPHTSAVFRNDGRGTQAELTTTAGTYHIIDSVADPLVITSPTHPEEYTWYRSRVFTATWPITANEEWSYVVTKNPFEIPDDFPDTPVGQVTFENLDDGVHYFILKRRIPGSPWKIVGRRRVRVDGTPPSIPQYAIGQDASLFEGKRFVAFSSFDTASGIAQYEVIEGSTATRPATSPYVLLDQLEQTGLRIRAIDQAGNTSEVVIREETAVRKLAIGWIVAGALFVAVCVLVIVWFLRKKEEPIQ
ncbi:MAG: cohesin domain-containing protein [Patescibacteria group bacterium]|jgi:hypothetical protein